MKSIASRLRQADRAGARPGARVLLPPRQPGAPGHRQVAKDLEMRLQAHHVGLRILVHGPPGVGKSSTVLEVAHRLAGAGTYGLVVWADCKSRSFAHSQVRKSDVALQTYTEVLREVALAAEFEGALRVPERELQQVLRVLLARQKTLLIVDSVDSIADDRISQFLLGLPDTVDVIATSNEALRWSDQLPIGAATLDSGDYRLEVHRLLADRGMSLRSEEVKELVALSEGVIQSAVVLVDLLAQGMTFESLRLEAGRHPILEFFFDERWRRVSGSPQLVSGSILLAMARSMPVDAMVEILQFSGLADNGMDVLSSLAKIHFIEIHDTRLVSMSANAARYTLKRSLELSHDAGPTLAAWLDSLSRRSIAARRQLTWSLTFEEMGRFRAELLLALKWTGNHSSAAVHASGLALMDSISYYLYSRALWPELLEAAAWAMPAAIARGARVPLLEMGLTWALRATIYRDGAGAGEAFFDRVKGLLTRFGMATSGVDVYLRVARVALRKKGCTPTEVAHGLQADARELAARGDFEWACRAMLQCGNVFSEANELDNAWRAFGWVRECAGSQEPSLWTREMEALCCGNQGIVANRSKDFRKARDLLEKAIDGLPQTYDRAGAHGELALALFETGHFLAASDHLKECLELSLELGLTASPMESFPGWEHQVGRQFLSARPMILRWRSFIWHLGWRTIPARLSGELR